MKVAYSDNIKMIVKGNVNDKNWTDVIKASSSCCYSCK